MYMCIYSTVITAGSRPTSESVSSLLKSLNSIREDYKKIIDEVRGVFEPYYCRNIVDSRYSEHHLQQHFVHNVKTFTMPRVNLSLIQSNIVWKIFTTSRCSL